MAEFSHLTLLTTTDYFSHMIWQIIIYLCFVAYILHLPIALLFVFRLIVRDDFILPIVNFPSNCSNNLAAPAYKVYIFQLI